MGLGHSAGLLLRELLHAGHRFYEVLHLHVLAVDVLVALLHPDLKDGCDAHDDTDLGDDDWVENVSVHRQFKLEIQHHDAERVSEEHENVVVHLLLLVDVDTNQFGRFQAGRPHDLVLVGVKVVLEHLEGLVTTPHLYNRSEELEPIARQVKPVLPAFDGLFMPVGLAEEGGQDQIRVVKQVVEGRRELANDQEQVFEG